MTNPFQVRWLNGWTFEVVLMEGKVQVEAQGFGIKLRTPLYPGESPQVAADRLVMAEDRRRRSLYQAWLRSQNDAPTNSRQHEPQPSTVPPHSLVVVTPQLLAA